MATSPTATSLVSGPRGSGSMLDGLKRAEFTLVTLASPLPSSVTSVSPVADPPVG